VTAVAVASSSTATDPTNAVADAENVVITSYGVSRTIDVETDDTAKAVAKKINAVAASTQVVASASTYAWFSTDTASTSTSARIKINGTETASFTMTANDVSDAVQKINSISSTTGVQATSTGDYKVLLKDADGDNIVIINTSTRTDLDIQAVGIDGETPSGYNASSAVNGTAELTFAASGSGTDTVNIRGNLKLSSNNDFKINQASATQYFTSGDTSAPLVNVSTLSVLTQIKASNSLAIIDGAIETVSSMRGSLGTLQNRLDYTVSNLLKVTEFNTAARSRIADADFAAETARLAKAQVLQQAGASMLSQANASTDTVLQLLRG
jgi:flagellin